MGPHLQPASHQFSAESMSFHCPAAALTAHHQVVLCGVELKAADTACVQPKDSGIHLHTNMGTPHHEVNARHFSETNHNLWVTVQICCAQDYAHICLPQIVSSTLAIVTTTHHTTPHHTTPHHTCSCTSEIMSCRSPDCAQVWRVWAAELGCCVPSFSSSYLSEA
jgi:hypothetical protein